MKIPKIFHHIWFGNKLPDHLEVYLQTWSKYHPDWEIIRWNESNIPPLKNWACYNNAKSLAQKSDIARYEILHELGGVYIDADFECLKNIDTLISDIDGFSASEHPPEMGTISIGIMGAVPHHPVFAELIKELPKSFDPKRPPNEVTGPALMKKVATKYKGFVVFGQELFYPIPWGKKEFKFPKENAYAVHHWMASWMKK